MLDGKQLAVAVARRVFPLMGKFSGGAAKLGLWDVHVTSGREVSWLTISLGRDMLFRIETGHGYVKAGYALPAVMTLANGEQEYGTVWARCRRWNVNDWVDVPRVSIGIRDFSATTMSFSRWEPRCTRFLKNQASEYRRIKLYRCYKMCDLKFRCLVTEDYHSMIDAIAFEMDAEVQYFHGRLNVISIHMLGKYIGFIAISGKNYATIREAVREMLSEC